MLYDVIVLESSTQFSGDYMTCDCDMWPHDHDHDVTLVPDP